MAKLDKQINRQLEAAGWCKKPKGKNHEVWLCPCGEHIVTKPTTMGKGRAAANIRSQFRTNGPCRVDLKMG